MKPKPPFVILALVILGAMLIWAQGSNGTFLPASYTGDDSFGFALVSYGQTTPTVQSQAQCISPNGGQWVQVALWQQPNCPDGSMVAINTFWPYPNTGYYVLQGRVNDNQPPPSSGAQGWWIAYNDCGSTSFPYVIHGNYCNYGCYGQRYQCGPTW